MILIPEKRDTGWLREGSTVAVDSEKRVQLQRELVMFRSGEGTKTIGRRVSLMHAEGDFG